MLKLEQADAIANRLEDILRPYCEKIKVAGSVRRRQPKVRDIDIVAIPKAPTLKPVIQGIADRVVRSGPKMATFIYRGVQVDIYYASAETWATLLLIRTGSKENNIRLCTLARDWGWHLAANGDGLFDELGRRIAGDSEEDIYGALGVAYQQPWERG